MIRPELHRPLGVERVGSRGLDMTVEASAEECAALAQRMNLPAIRSLQCRFVLTQEGKGKIFAEGTLRSEITQTCVITMEDFDAVVAETFRLRFVPAGEESADIDPDDDDEIPFEGSTIDLGEAAAEQLGLALDPYPRMPGAELPQLEETDDENPFAALRRLN